MRDAVRNAIEDALEDRIESAGPLTGGCVGEVYRVSTPKHGTVVVKVDSSTDPRLDIEGYMLEYLAERSRLPVPAVLYNTPSLLIMEFVEGDSYFDAEVETHAADLLADLHSVDHETFGLEQDTLIGGLPQSNRPTERWVPFFAEQRLLDMGQQAVAARRMGRDTLARLEGLAGRLDDYIEEPDRPALLHGDIWSGNVMAKAGRITAFIDPAIYYGHPEIELAFITLFSTFGGRFFDRYSEHRPVPREFFELRRDIYNLFPLLVHVTLFGGGYLGSVENTLNRFV